MGKRVPFGLSVLQKIILVLEPNAAATWRELSINKVRLIQTVTTEFKI